MIDILSHPKSIIGIDGFAGGAGVVAPPIFSLHSVSLHFFSLFGKFCNIFVPFGNLCNSFIPSGSFFGLTFSVGVEKSRLLTSFLLSD